MSDITLPWSLGAFENLLERLTLDTSDFTVVRNSAALNDGQPCFALEGDPGHLTSMVVALSMLFAPSTEEDDQHGLDAAEWVVMGDRVTAVWTHLHFLDQ